MVFIVQENVRRIIQIRGTWTLLSPIIKLIVFQIIIWFRVDLHGITIVIIMFVDYMIETVLCVQRSKINSSLGSTKWYWMKKRIL